MSGRPGVHGDRCARHQWRSSVIPFLLVCLTAAVAARADEPGQVPVPRERQEQFPRELVQWTASEHNPVFTGRGPGHWDERIRERGWIMHEGDQWRMWYTGYQPGGPMKLGYATSADGIEWTRHGDNPIYDEHWVEDMMVVRREGTYYMFAEGLRDRAQLLTSTDGIHWTRQWTLDIRRTNGEPLSEGPFGTPTAWFADGRWHLLYERRDEAIWLATSTDLKTWVNVQDEPVLRPGPEAYDSKLVAVNQLVPYEGRYYIIYHGLGDTDGNWTTNVAVSSDLLHWEKYAKNPLFPVDANKSSGILIPDGPRFRLYTMHNAVQLHLPGE